MHHIAKEDESVTTWARGELLPLPHIINHEKGAKPAMDFAPIYINMCKYLLELCCLWSTWEWNDVTDVLHTSNKEDETFETKTEATMWT